MKTLKEIGLRIQAIRKQRGESQGALAKRLGHFQAHVSRTEAGENIKISTLLQFADKLGFDIHFIPRKDFQIPKSEEPESESHKKDLAEKAAKRKAIREKFKSGI